MRSPPPQATKTNPVKTPQNLISRSPSATITPSNVVSKSNNILVNQKYSIIITLFLNNDAENIKKFRPKKYPQYGLFLMDFFHEFFFFTAKLFKKIVALSVKC